MDNSLIVYPAFSMVCLTFILYIKNRLDVGTAIKEKKLELKYVKLYNIDPPDYVDLSRQTLKNQFESPILFYVLVCMLFVNDNLTNLDLVLAWIYAISRYLHAYIRLSRNYIPHRALVFTLGLVILLVSWISFLTKL